MTGTVLANELDGTGEYDGWIEGVPMHDVGADGLMLQVGSDIGPRGGSLMIRVPVTSLDKLDPAAYRKLAKSIRVRLRELTEENMAQSTLGLLDPDDPRSIPDQRPFDSNWAVVFWMRPPTGTTPLGADLDTFDADSAAKPLPHTRGRPVLALRFGFSRGNVESIKAALAAERRDEAPGTWLAKPWQLWCVWDWRAIPGVLGRLRAAGLKLMWVNREGLPKAPPVVDPTLLANNEELRR